MHRRFCQKDADGGVHEPYEGLLPTTGKKLPATGKIDAIGLKSLNLKLFLAWYICHIRALAGREGSCPTFPLTLLTWFSGRSNFLMMWYYGGTVSFRGKPCAVVRGAGPAMRPLLALSASWQGTSSPCTPIKKRLCPSLDRPIPNLHIHESGHEQRERKARPHRAPDDPVHPARACGDRR